MQDKSIFSDKNKSLIKKIGRSITEQRIKVFNETELDFSKRLSQFIKTTITEEDVIKMEEGDGSIPMDRWMAVWQITQVAEKVVESARSESALFLASTKHLMLDEKSVKMKTPKK